MQHGVAAQHGVQRGGLDDGQRRLLLQAQHAREQLQLVQLAQHRPRRVRRPVRDHRRALPRALPITIIGVGHGGYVLLKVWSGRLGRYLNLTDEHS